MNNLFDNLLYTDSDGWVVGNMNKDLLYAAALSMEEVYFTKGQHIIIQDQVGDTFYLIEEGQVVVTVSLPSLI